MSFFDEFIEFGAANYPKFYNAEAIKRLRFESVQGDINEIGSVLLDETLFYKKKGSELFLSKAQWFARVVYHSSATIDYDMREADKRMLDRMSEDIEVIQDCITILQKGLLDCYLAEDSVAIQQRRQAIDYLRCEASKIESEKETLSEKDKGGRLWEKISKRKYCKQLIDNIVMTGNKKPVGRLLAEVSTAALDKDFSANDFEKAKT